VVKTPVPHGWRRPLAFAVPPTAWLAHLLVSYLLVPPTCGTTTVPLHVATVVLAAAAVAATTLVVGTGEATRRTGLALGVVFVLAIVMQGAASAMVDPCG
jgi:hypothetical protein